MKALLVSFLLLGSLALKAQTKIELTDVSKHIGDAVIVKGKVFSSRAVSGGKLLLINLGGGYPNQLLTVVVQEAVQKVLAEPLKSKLEELTVAGKVELYKDKPQIVVAKPEQIQRLVTEKAGTKN